MHVDAVLQKLGLQNGTGEHVGQHNGQAVMQLEILTSELLKSWLFCIVKEAC